MSAAGPWIISRDQDLIWFHGSVIAGVALLTFFALAPPLNGASDAPTHPAVLALLLWGIVFDGTHVFGTYARSYLVADPAARQALPDGRSWAVLVVGPVIAIADHAVCIPGPSLLAQAGWLFRSFLLFAYLFAYWHLVRQHYGFLALYRRRAQAEDDLERRLETFLLWLGCLYPYLRFSLSEAYLHSGLPVLLPTTWLATLRIVVDVAAALIALVAVTMLARRTPAFSPRHLLLVVVIGFHLAVFATLDNLLTITATLTIFHNLQYHRIVWQHERDHRRTPARGLARYVGLGLVLGIVWYGPRIWGVLLVRDDLARNLLIGLGWGVAFHHYLVDGRIWRVRRPLPAQAAAILPRAA